MDSGDEAADGVGDPDELTVGFDGGEDSVQLDPEEGFALAGEFEDFAYGGGDPEVLSVEGEGLGEGSGGEFAEGPAIEGELGDGVGAEVDNPDMASVEDELGGETSYGEGLDDGGGGRLSGGMIEGEPEGDAGGEGDEKEGEEAFHVLDLWVV